MATPFIFVIPLLAGSLLMPAARQVVGPASLAREEVFVQQTGLKVTLELPAPTLRVGQDPRLTVRFLNEGGSVLYLNPHVEAGLHVTRPDGTPVTPAAAGIGDRAAPPRVRRADLISLGPGRSWSVAVSPTRMERDRYAAYAEQGFTKGAGWALLLPPGKYVARFVYVNAPDYWASYDPYEMPSGVWEGRLESEPVPFTVIAPAAEQLAGDAMRLGQNRPGGALLPLLVLSPAQLVEEFIRRPAVRLVVAQAARLHAEPLASRLLAALDSIPQPDRDMVLYSAEFTTLLREQADCAIVRRLAGALATTSGDVLHAFRPVFEKAAQPCADVRDQLRSLAASGTAPAHARSNAAALLGSYRNPADVPLLIELLDRTPSGNSDPIPGGAATGLLLVGGGAARQALARALGDDRRNYIVGPRVVSRLGSAGGPDAAEPLLAALSSANANIVVSALSAIRSVGAGAAMPRLLELLNHRNPTIRSSAAAAIRATRRDDARDAMRRAVEDRDENVRQNALFYLAEYGEKSDIVLFVRHLDAGHDYIREAARNGVMRFGTAATYPQVRKLLDASHPGIKQTAESTLGFLTFAKGARMPWTPAQWDAWYAGHRGTSRTEWAREAVAALEGADLYDEGPGIAALAFLADQGTTRFRQEFERAANGRRPTVRVEAAKAIGRVDPRRAASLLIREFDGRLIGGCDLANRALNELRGQQRRVDCTDPAARRRAKADWER